MKEFEVRSYSNVKHHCAIKLGSYPVHINGLSYYLYKCCSEDYDISFKMVICKFSIWEFLWSSSNSLDQLLWRY